MKKTLLIMSAILGVVMSAKADVEFAYDAGAEIVSAYIWRGQYNGGLSFQPDLEVGFDADHSSFRAGVWASLGASDWMFRKKGWDAETGAEEPGEYTRFMPELDVILSYTVWGATLGFNHYYYFGGSNFFSWQSMDKIIAEENTSTTEIWVGYNAGELIMDCLDLHVNWNTTIAGNDFVWNDEGNPKRAWSSYLEVGAGFEFEKIGLAAHAELGFSPWASDLYGNEKFALINLSARVEKSFEVGPCSLSVFLQGSINPDGLNKETAYIKGCGYDKLYNQKLNGVLGFGVWF